MLKTVAAFDRIGEENAFAVLARAMHLAAQGRDIVNLGIGQPDFRTPDFIVEGVVMRRLESGIGSGNLRAGSNAILTHGRPRDQPSRDR